jgi:hypothetical protein
MDLLERGVLLLATCETVEIAWRCLSGDHNSRVLRGGRWEL